MKIKGKYVCTVEIDMDFVHTKKCCRSRKSKKIQSADG